MRTLVSVTALYQPGTRSILMSFQYAISKSKAPLGLVGSQWRERILAQLNTAMSDWVQSLPDHSAFVHAFLYIA